MSEECKVPLFGYFQQNISSWENWHIDHSATINQILGIYKKQLSEEKDNILKQINIGFNEQFETNLNESVTKFNKLSKQYLDVVDNYDIDLSNKRAWGPNTSRTSLPQFPWAQNALGPLGYATS